MLMCLVLELQKVLPAKKIGTIVLTHLQPESISVLKSLLELMQLKEDDPIDIVAAVPAIRLLQSSLGKTKKVVEADWVM